MTHVLASLQKEIHSFVIENGLNTDIRSHVLDLSSEVGELAKEILKATDYGKRSFLSTRQFEEEVGDVLFVLTRIANDAGIDLAMAIHGTLQKMKCRIEEKGHPGSDGQV